jgi:hypothetical protein
VILACSTGPSWPSTCLIVLTLGFRLSRGVSTAEDFYIGRRRHRGGRSASRWWPPTSVHCRSSAARRRAPATASRSSPSTSNYPIVLFVVVSVFLPFFYNSGVASIYDYVEERFRQGVVAGRLGGLPAVAGAADVGGCAVRDRAGRAVRDGRGRRGRRSCSCLPIALLYTFMGGTVAVIWTDVFQASVLFHRRLRDRLLLAAAPDCPMPLRGLPAPAARHRRQDAGAGPGLWSERGGDGVVRRDRDVAVSRHHLRREPDDGAGVRSRPRTSAMRRSPIC